MEHNVAAPSREEFRARFLSNLRYLRGLELPESSIDDLMSALVLTVREHLVDRFVASRGTHRRLKPKTVYYLSLEYLPGRLLADSLRATGLWQVAHDSLGELGLDLTAIFDAEVDPGLGNGGLGRLAACFLESLATLQYPALGYGLRYDYGIFRQEFRQGWQHEQPDKWLKGGHLWGMHRPDQRVAVPIGGHVLQEVADDGAAAPRWQPANSFYGTPHDVLVAGHGTRSVALLRLWRAEAPDDFDFGTFSQGDFLHAVASRERVDSITKVLYPSDEVEAGRLLRLTQEYFLVACAVRDITARFRRRMGDDWRRLPEQVAIQLNDTHPALVIAELMRFLVDEAGVPWAEAWPLVVASCAYTNHTLLPEALETWPVGTVEQLLPRHAEIVLDINKQFLDEVRTRFPGDEGRARRLSLVHEDGQRRFRMAHLAIVGSHKVNGVARLHTELLTRQVVPDFAELWPERFLAITNGVTPRRWLLSCNPRLAAAITSRIGPDWTRDLELLRELEPFAEDEQFQQEFRAIKRANKEALAAETLRLTGVEIDPGTLFDVQVKRLHEYKRQLLNAMHIIALYRRIKANPAAAVVPRTFVFAAKAAPSYRMAKLIIRLIHAIGEAVNGDPDVAGRLKVVFLPDYRVSLAEKIIPAADLSEQISTAGKEASGTGNMKFALNGALTIGTLDGANIEIRDAVGDDNIFIFGHTVEQAAALRAGGYDPAAWAATDPELVWVIEALRDGDFVGGDRTVLHDIYASLIERGDPYLHIADFRSYVDTLERAAALYTDQRAWTATAIRNVARMGYFSSDRAIREYAERIWRVEPVPPDQLPELE